MRRLLVIFVFLLFGTQAYGGTAEAPSEEGAGGGHGIPVGVTRESEEWFHGKFVFDFGEKFTRHDVVSLIRGGAPTAASEDLLTRLLGMSFSPSNVGMQREFFGLAQSQTKPTSDVRTYKDLYDTYICPLRGCYALWVSQGRIPDVWSQKLGEVEQLRIQGDNHRRLTSMNNDVLYVFGKLRGLFLDDNCLTSPPDVTQNPKLQMLSVSSNCLTCPPDVTQNPALKVLLLQYNHLRTAPNTTKNLELQDLHLEGNGLASSPDVSQNSKLQLLYLGDNGFKTFPSCVLPALIRLDLRGNHHFAQEGGEGHWGRRELCDHFGDKVIF